MLSPIQLGDSDSIISIFSTHLTTNLVRSENSLLLSSGQACIGLLACENKFHMEMIWRIYEQNYAWLPTGNGE